MSAAQDHSSSFIRLTTAVTCLSTARQMATVFTAVTSQIAASSLELRALPLGNRKLADEQARELGYLGYSGHFDDRPRSSSGRASECSRIGLQKALFEPLYGQVHDGLVMRTLISASVLPDTTGRVAFEIVR